MTGELIKEQLNADNLKVVEETPAVLSKDGVAVKKVPTQESEFKDLIKEQKNAIFEDELHTGWIQNGKINDLKEILNQQNFINQDKDCCLINGYKLYYFFLFF